MSLYLPENAPFSGTQRMWLNGFLDGISSTLASPSGSTAAPAASIAPPAGHPVTIIWGSQTGTSESLGKKVAKTLTKKGHIPTLLDMGEVTPDLLSKTERLLILTSTYGDGEPPDNAADLYASLHEDSAPQMPSLTYSVLALGDSSYPDFCKCGQDFDSRLAALGASRMLPIVECDVDYDEPFEEWLSSVESALTPA